MTAAALKPEHDCQKCPRLAAFRADNKIKFPDKFNAPVPSFGELDAALLVVGLAPGLKGANFSGRPFTGDYAGDLLYDTLLKYGFAEGVYQKRADDGLHLKNCRITNAVRCVPPENKPVGPEINQCLNFLRGEIAAMKNLKVLVTLGSIAHNAVIKTLKGKASAHKFGHGNTHSLGGVTVLNSYHCSRYNTQTKRLTDAMFHEIFVKARTLL